MCQEKGDVLHHMNSFTKIGNTIEKEDGVMRKKDKKINLEEIDESEKLKYEIAEELGLLEKVMEQGWKSLTAKETGRIGGLITKRKRES